MANNDPKVNVFARNRRHVDEVLSSSKARDLFSKPGNALICIEKNTVNSTSFSDSKPPLPEKIVFSHVLFLFTELPVRIETIEEWKSWVLQNNISEYRMDFLRIGEFTASYVEGRMLRHCRNWDKEKPKEEGAPDERWKSIGDLVSLPNPNDKDHGNTNKSFEKDSPELLTATFGTMGEVMMRIHDVYSRFKNTLNLVVSSPPKKESKLEKRSAQEEKKDIIDIASRQKEIAKLLQFPADSRNCTEKDWWPVSFPKLLLYGETGVGKTLVSRYLHKQIAAANQNGCTGRPLRISIPEFVGKEEDFEYALFGYAKGAYTGGLENGSIGLLIENMGQVVFLDEIEEANNTIQAKLLAFMDDYRVRPRGWLGKSFYCPVLIVAATNCSVAELRKRNFRKDLLARFTDVETVPPLRERKEIMDFIIDSLLQQESITLNRTVSKIGKYALARLKGYSYEEGNFRELEDVLRNACASARRDGRDYLCECDIVFD